MAEQPRMTRDCSLVPSVLCCFAFSLSQDWELPAKREVRMWPGWFLALPLPGGLWCSQVTCVVPGWSLPVTGAVLCTGGEAATEGGCSGHAGEAPPFQLGHRWMTLLLAARWLPGPPQSWAAWQAPPFNRKRAEPWPASGLPPQGRRFREGNAPEPVRASPPHARSWQKQILVASSASLLNVFLGSVFPRSLRKPWFINQKPCEEVKSHT